MLHCFAYRQWRQGRSIASDKLAHGFGVAPGKIAQRPADGLSDEKVLFLRELFCVTEEPRSIRIVSPSALMQHRRAADPQVPVLHPLIHQRMAFARVPLPVT